MDDGAECWYRGHHYELVDVLDRFLGEMHREKVDGKRTERTVKEEGWNKGGFSHLAESFLATHLRTAATTPCPNCVLSTAAAPLAVDAQASMTPHAAA